MCFLVFATCRVFFRFHLSRFAFDFTPAAFERFFHASLVCLSCFIDWLSRKLIQSFVLSYLWCLALAVFVVGTLFSSHALSHIPGGGILFLVVMDPFSSPINAVTFTVWILPLILNFTESYSVPLQIESEEECDDTLSAIVSSSHRLHVDLASVMRDTLHNYRLCTSFSFFDDDVGFWVKPQSTTWFSQFLLEQYYTSRWISMFRMTKGSVFALVDLLRPNVERQNTKYHVAIAVLIRVACTLFKLTHIWSKLHSYLYWNVCNQEEHCLYYFERSSACY